MTAMVSARLWERGAALARRSLEHPLVQGLASGELPAAAWRAYVAQDAFFLRAFARGYARGLLAAGEDEALQRRFHALCGAVFEELELHRGQAEALGIELASVTPLAGTRAYVDFLEATGARGGLAELVAAMVPCMRLYAWLGQQLQPRDHPDHPYGEWIRTYAGEGFGAAAADLEALLDELAARSGAPTLERLGPIYDRALELEAGFWSGPWEEGRS